MENKERTTILKGRFEEALYKKQEIEEYSNNAFIEALPPIYCEEEIIDTFTTLPIITEADRNKAHNLRCHVIKRAKNFIQPLPIHITLERKLSILIRRGYLGRNPSEKIFLESLRILNGLEDKSIIENKLKEKLNSVRSTADSISIIGISGIGKTTAIERLLLMYPQVIRHSKYKNQNFTRTQIVWLKIDCPYDGSLSTLCKSFFEAIDSILGTRYFEKFGYSNRVTSTMLINMTKLAWKYGIGVLVIDEIQHLLNTKNDKEEMLNFFVTLTNTVGIPTVLIGTSKAQKVFDGNFRQARRAASEGCIMWDRMKKDSEEWNFFLESIWEFQGLKIITKLTDKIKDVFYDECQGITSVAVNLFLLSQERALQDNCEELTINIIRETAKKDLHIIQPMIKALRNNNLSQIKKYEDISINLEEVSNSYERNIAMVGIIQEAFKERKKDIKLIRKSVMESLVVELSEMGLFSNLDVSKLVNICEKIVEDSNINDDYNEIKKRAIKEAMVVDEKLKIKNNITQKQKSSGSLIEIYELAKKQKKHPYELLKQKGFIKNPVDEFLKFN